MPLSTNTAKIQQTCPCTTSVCPYLFARFPLRGIFKPTRTIPVNNELTQQCDGASESLRTKFTCMASAGRHPRPWYKHCKPCTKHAHVSPPHACTHLHSFHSVRISIQPVPVHMNNNLKQQCDSTTETSRNNKLQVA